MPPPANTFPSSLNAWVAPLATTLRNASGFELHSVIAQLQAHAQAVEAKLGLGASAPGGTPAVLRRSAAGASLWSPLDGTELGSNSIQTTHIADNAINSAKILDRSIVGADIASRTLNGSDHIALATITAAELATNAVTQLLRATPSTNNPATTAASSGAAVVLAECSIPITTAGGPVACWFSGTFLHSVAASVIVLEIRLDGVVRQARSALIDGAGGRLEVSLHETIPAASIPAGPHTLAIYFWSTTGATLTNNALDRAFSVLEVKR